MNHAREVLEEVRAKRLTEERIDALKKPWHTPLRPLLSQIPWVGFIVWSSCQDHLAHSWAFIGCSIGFAIFSIWGLLDALKDRDQKWRELIEREAPALHARLSKKEPNQTLEPTAAAGRGSS